MKMKTWAWALMILLPALGALGAGCSRNQGRILVPVQETAAEQFMYAQWVRQNSTLELMIHEKSRYLTERRRIRAAYAQVVESFPADRTSTPLARLILIEMDAGLDERHAPNSRRGDQRAIEQLDRLIKEYPEYDFIQAKGLYNMAQLHKRRGEFEDATRLFKHVADNYSAHENEIIRELALRSRYFYQHIYMPGA